MLKLTDSEFQYIYEFMKSNYGINLVKKRELIESRLSNYLASKSIKSFNDYINLIKGHDNEEIANMITKLTTNHTYFLREIEHFNFLKEVILPYHKANNKYHDIRTWSAGCSSGEEAFTITMVMKEFFGLESTNWDTKILATDISTKVLNAAKNGIYTTDSLSNIPEAWQKKYFNKQGDVFELKPQIKNEVIFKVFNLMDTFHHKKPFDIIFCRNVMIYFDQETKNQLTQKFYDALAPGGYLLIGHSESIPRNVTNFNYIKPSIYQKGG